MLGFYPKYFVFDMLFLLTEITIGLFAHDAFERPYGGDFMVVLLLYCLVKSFLNSPVVATAIAVLLFSCIVETLQYFHIVRMLGLAKYALARVIFGTNFSWTDILVYTFCAGLVLLVEFRRKLIAEPDK